MLFHLYSYLIELVKPGLFYIDCNLFVCCNQFKSLLLQRLLQYQDTRIVNPIAEIFFYDRLSAQLDLYTIRPEPLLRKRLHT